MDVELAHEFMFSQPVSVMNLEELSKRFQISFDGLLGQDMLNQFHSVLGVTPLEHTILSGQYPGAKAPLVLGNGTKPLMRSDLIAMQLETSRSHLKLAW